MNAVAPWGLNVREFIIVLIAFSGIILASLTVIIAYVLGTSRDRAVARYQAQAAESKRQEIAERRLLEIAKRAEGILTTPQKNAPERPAMLWGNLADRGEVPRELLVQNPGNVTQPPRVSAAADREAGRTRLDLTPTEET